LSFFYFLFFFFFQAEDGIRDTSVTGVQTCALPISNELGFNGSGPCTLAGYGRAPVFTAAANVGRRVSPAILGRVEGTIQYFREEIGRASCREIGWVWVGVGAE